MDRVRAAVAPALALLAAACVRPPDPAVNGASAAPPGATVAAASAHLPRPPQVTPPPRDRPIALRCEAARSSGMGLHIALRFIRREAVVTPFGDPDAQPSTWSLFWSEQLYLLDREGSGGTHRLAIDRVTGAGALIGPPGADEPVVPIACYRVQPRL